MMNLQTLMLDRGYAPLGIVSWEDAVTLLYTGKVEVVAEYDDEIRSAYTVIKVPAVIRAKHAVNKKVKPVKFSRVNVYGRDGYRCQYCGARCTMKELTYDHVLPRSQGGKTNWLNIVSACMDCNSKKACRTPEQAKMRLLKKPVQPLDTPAVRIPVSKNSIPDAWRDYVWWTTDLDQD
jgi:5-methylcytosine-specific restriction endonuclease McrA